MYKTFWTGFCSLAYFSLPVTVALACHEYPVSDIVDSYKYVSVGEYVTFDGSGIEYEGTGSYDPDNYSSSYPGPYGGGEGINIYDWWFWDGSQWDQGPGGCSWTRCFEQPGNFIIDLEVKDDDGDWSGWDSCYVHVSLPSGCSYAGRHDSSIHWNDSQNYNSPGSPFGYFTEKKATCNVDFKYSSGKWVCQISNVKAKTACYVISPDTPGLVCIDKASDVPCEPPTEPIQAKIDLTDTNLDDDKGPPYKKYWVHRAVVAHEECHRSEWKGFYKARLDAAIHWCELLRRDIDCSDPLTHTCEGAKSFWIASIDKALYDAHKYAKNDMDPPGTPLKEDEQRAYYLESFINHAIANALPEGCGP
ncbi:hypothetical protein ES705_30016 [subsurface metagenome]